MNIPLIKPFITQEIKDKVLEVLDSGYLTEGPVTKEFENRLKEFLGVNYCLAVTSATTGLEMALRALKVGVGDEVIVPDYTYPATASVAPIVGATAVIVDVSKKNMLIDYDALEAAITPKTKAIIPVSLFGAPLDYDRLNAIKDKYKLYIIEDAACSIGAEFKGEKVGKQADITVFSLHPRKFITTGEGGIVTTENEELAEWMNSYKHFGMDMTGASREGIHFSNIGTNYKLTNLQAAVGLGQLDHIEALLSKRIELANNYESMLRNVEGVTLTHFSEKETCASCSCSTKQCKHSYQTFSIFIKDRDRIMTSMREKGIEVQIGTYSLHMHTAFQNNSLVEIKGEMANSKWCYEHALALPLYNDLTEDLQKHIVIELINSLKSS
ncbi:DegT/DnrJ/EryC1/StrS family aminotransferase [Fulvivirga lutimaris]|uniref:DegT/DnrJ/EryC1/StrS family aminotransferase n=1 Tax=Fulvivirga lutimaris TaxID=1819566 RepID=UPI0012BC0F81|nr:DegT/DnrJ/EryC1/StrS family aminotransferase [Fulvivirga lutimaris]MTI39302.1 DegT/DnrJ/EryC1/StrS family aminotransferase [Fulvivirga lutimaris]